MPVLLKPVSIRLISVQIYMFIFRYVAIQAKKVVFVT